MKTTLPDFLIDEGVKNWAIVIAGRVLEDPPKTQAATRRVEAFVRQWGQQAGLPLAYVHLGTTINWEARDDDKANYESAPAAIGLVLAHGDWTGPSPLSRASLDAGAAAAIPATFWKELEAQHSLAPRGEGLYLVPAGWTAASIYDGSAQYEDGRWLSGAKPLLSCSTDGSAGLRLDGRELPEAMFLFARAA